MRFYLNFPRLLNTKRQMWRFVLFCFVFKSKARFLFVYLFVCSLCYVCHLLLHKFLFLFQLTLAMDHFVLCKNVHESTRLWKRDIVFESKWILSVVFAAAFLDFFSLKKHKQYSMHKTDFSANCNKYTINWRVVLWLEI